jgi:hypothetical protein
MLIDDTISLADIQEITCNELNSATELLTTFVFNAIFCNTLLLAS